MPRLHISGSRPRLMAAMAQQARELYLQVERIAGTSTKPPKQELEELLARTPQRAIDLGEELACNARESFMQENEREFFGAQVDYPSWHLRGMTGDLYLGERGRVHPGYLAWLQEASKPQGKHPAEIRNDGKRLERIGILAYRSPLVEAVVEHLKVIFDARKIAGENFPLFRNKDVLEVVLNELSGGRVLFVNQYTRGLREWKGGKLHPIQATVALPGPVHLVHLAEEDPVAIAFQASPPDAQRFDHNGAYVGLFDVHEFAVYVGSDVREQAALLMERIRKGVFSEARRKKIFEFLLMPLEQRLVVDIVEGEAGAVSTGRKD